MAKYYFNPDNLQYEQIENTSRDRWFAFMKFTLLVTLFSVFVLKVSEDVVQSPKLKKLTAERQELAYELQLLNRDLQLYQEHLDRIAYNDDHLYRVFFEVDPIPATKREAGRS